MHPDGSDGESVGHHSGRRIVEILRKREDEFTEDDTDHMKVSCNLEFHLIDLYNGSVISLSLYLEYS